MVHLDLRRHPNGKHGGWGWAQGISTHYLIIMKGLNDISRQLPTKTYCTGRLANVSILINSPENYCASCINLLLHCLPFVSTTMLPISKLSWIWVSIPGRWTVYTHACCSPKWKQTAFLHSGERAHARPLRNSASLYRSGSLMRLA